MSSFVSSSEFLVNLYFALHEENKLNNFKLINYLVIIIYLFYLLNILKLFQDFLKLKYIFFFKFDKPNKRS